MKQDRIIKTPEIIEIESEKDSIKIQKLLFSKGIFWYSILDNLYPKHTDKPFLVVSLVHFRLVLFYMTNRLISIDTIKSSEYIRLHSPTWWDRIKLFCSNKPPTASRKTTN